MAKILVVDTWPLFLSGHQFVILSGSAAVLAASAAFDLHCRKQENGLLQQWLIMSGALGTGIWAVHFLGMSAYAHTAAAYNLTGVVLAWVTAFAGAGAAFAVTIWRSRTVWRAVSGVLAGAAVVAVHYISMAALNVYVSRAHPAALLSVPASCAIVVAAFLALPADLQSPSRGRAGRYAFASLAMGAAILTTHFADLLFSQLVPGRVPSGRWLINEALITVIAAAVTCSAVWMTRLPLGRALKDRDAHYRLLADSLRDLVLLYDADGTLLYVSPSVERLLGYTPQEWLCDSPRSPLLDQLQNLVPFRDAALQGVSGTTELRLRKADGEYLWVETRISPVLDKDGRVAQIQTVSRDISERKAAEERLWHQAHHDEVTGLPRRRLFVERVEQFMRSGEPVALLVIDLDGLERVNPRLGFESGDLLLRAMAGRLSALPFDLTARLVGTIFASYLPARGGVRALHEAAAQVQQAFAAPLPLHREEILVTPTIGMVLGDRCEPPQDLIRRAYLALAEALRLGRGSVFLANEETNGAALRRLTLSSDLPHAVERGQVSLCYQPIICLSTGQLAGFEALARWHHPTLGAVPPGEFIQLAEETGFILHLGLWILGSACRQLALWRLQSETARDLYMSVNLSARQLSAGNLPGEVAAILTDCQLSPSSLQLEITETATMQDPKRAISLVSELKSMGIRVVLDDFGTGFSSLSYLSRLPVDGLKIDRCFMRGLLEPGADRAVIQVIMSAARSLGLTTTAEGVETQHQLTSLRGLGCDQVQGYLFAKPMPPDEAWKYMSERT